MTTSYAIEAGRPTGAELRSWRLRAGLTQRELAGMAECSLAHIANMEHGAIPQQSQVLGRVLRILNNDDDPGSTPGRREESARTRRHDEA